MCVQLPKLAHEAKLNAGTNKKMLNHSPSLGRLTPVDLRDIWRSEDQHFTPWLAREDNIEVLGEALGLDLEVEAQERNVGRFRADILCKDRDDDTWVLIENQLEQTDHGHLGQLMTYAAGLKAVTIVWVAKTIREEHRAALDWLNAITDDSFRFFGVEVQLWKIGESTPAPRFNIVSKPNQWSKSVSQATRRIEAEAITETKKLQLEFWALLQERLEKHPSLRTQAPQPRHWTTVPIGRSGMHLGATINTRDNSVAVELYLGDDNADAFFAQLRDQRDVIEGELGYAVEWQDLPNRRACRIKKSRPDSVLASKEVWQDYLSWIERTLSDFDRVFRQRVRALNADDYEPEDTPENE